MNGVNLLTPGPTPVPPAVREAMARPMIPHRSPAFVDLLGRLRPGLKDLFRAAGPIVFFSGSGTMAVESAQWSLVRPGDRALSLSSGRFGERWGTVFDRMTPTLGLVHDRLRQPWGVATDLDRLDHHLQEHPDTALVTVVHSETSTGARNDLEAIARVVRERAPGALLIADVVTSLGAIPLEMDGWGVDAAVCASQKALMLPPGMGLVALGPRAVERLETSEPVCPLAMDLRWHADAWNRGTVACTPPAAHVFGLEASLRMIREQGLERRWREVSRLARATRAALVAMGFRLASDHPVDSVTAAFYPEGVDDGLRVRLRERRDVWLAGGQDRWAGRALRFSHMGAVGEAETVEGIEAIAAELAGVADAQAGLDAMRAELEGAPERDNGSRRL